MAPTTLAKWTRTALVLVLLPLWASAQEDAAPPDAPSDPAPRARIFFSGHSLLDRPLPDFVALIAESQGADLRWNMQNIEGSSIRRRSWGEGGWGGLRDGRNREGSGMDVVEEWRSPRTLPSGERYDTLIITERHDLPGVLQWEDATGFLRHYHDLFQAANPGGRTFFYYSWLELNLDDPAPWIAYEKGAEAGWQCIAGKVNLTLASEGREDRVQIIPGTTAMVHLVERILAGEVRGIGGTTRERLMAIFTDGVHLTPLGMYYMAAVHYGTALRASPVGARGPEGANEDTVRDLQTIAWDFTRKHAGLPPPEARSMSQCRERIARDACPMWSLRGKSHLQQPCVGIFENPRAYGNPFVWRLPPQPGADGWHFLALGVLGCAVASVLAARAGFASPGEAHLRRRPLLTFWLVVALLMLLYGLFLALELHSPSWERLQALLRSAGLYSVKKVFQLLIGLLLSAAAVGAAVAAAMRLRRTRAPHRGALLGLVLLVASAVLRAEPFHRFDFSLAGQSLRLNVLLVVVGILLVALSAWRAAKVRRAPSRITL